MAVYASRNLQLMALVLVCAVPRLGPVEGLQPTQFFFDHFSISDPNLRISGDAVVSSSGTLNLTKPGLSKSSVGHSLYGTRIELVDTDSGDFASFSTNFSFQIGPGKAQSGCGEGLALMLTTVDVTSGIYGSFVRGPYLGIPTLDSVPSNFQNFKTVAVEYDTFQDVTFGSVSINDINANHVGLDIEHIESTVQVDAGSVGVSLADGSLITTWIDYSGETTTLEVRISRSSGDKPKKPLLSYQMDLSDSFRENNNLYVGISASSGVSSCDETHSICSWGFRSWGAIKNSPALHSPPPSLLTLSSPSSPPAHLPPPMSHQSLMRVPLDPPPGSNKGPVLPPPPPPPSPPLPVSLPHPPLGPSGDLIKTPTFRSDGGVLASVTSPPPPAYKSPPPSVTSPPPPASMSPPPSVPSPPPPAYKSPPPSVPSPPPPANKSPPPPLRSPPPPANKSPPPPLRSPPPPAYKSPPPSLHSPPPPAYKSPPPFHHSAPPPPYKSPPATWAIIVAIRMGGFFILGVIVFWCWFARRRLRLRFFR